MKDLRDSLAAIGFRHPRRAPECWRISRIDTPLPVVSRGRRDPARSRTLRRWRDRLADHFDDSGQPLPYRITPLDRRSARA